jgi:hypothetical protein
VGDDYPELKDVYIPPDKLGELRVCLKQNEPAIVKALYWAAGKGMGQQAVAAALGAFQKFAEENPPRREPEGPVPQGSEFAKGVTF